MRTWRAVTAGTTATLFLAGCDPEAPVQSSDVSAEIEAAIAVHAADSGTHSNLLVAASRVTGTIDGSQIANDSIGFAQLATNSVTGDEIVDQSITSADLGTGTVGSTHLIDGSVTAAKLANGSVDNTKLAAGAVQNGNLALNAVQGGLAGVIMDGSITAADVMASSLTGGQILDGSIMTGDLANDAVTTAKIADANVTTAKIADANVTSAKIADANVTSAKIADANVTNAKLADGAISLGAKVNLEMVGQIQDASAAMFNTTILSFTEDTTDRVVTVIGACESNVNGSQIRLTDDNEMQTAACANTNFASPPSFFSLTVTADDANGDTVSLLVNAGMNNGLVRWRIYGITVQ